MNVIIFITLSLYAITNIYICVASAGCPCHIPCTGKPEICTCYGPCGDDGYGCKSNGEEYEFKNQYECRENEWVVQCIRTASCSPHIKDDTNPYAAYEQAVADNILIDDQFDDDEDAINHDDISSASSTSMAWFGGNWFDFWGKNSDQFFGEDLIQNNDENIKATKYSQDFNDNDEITIDNQDFDSLSSSSSASQRTLQQSSKQQNIPVMDDLGRNEAGYKIIALPLYILIICIVGAALIGMLMCAGFVYCGLNCCCPIPPSSPSLTSQQRSHTLEMARTMGLFTLGGGSKAYESDGVYRRMGSYLHNPTNDEASSISSLSRVDDEDGDEYANDSEDDKKENHVTRGNMDDYDFKGDYDDDEEDEDEVIVLRAIREPCDSDIGNDSDDTEIAELSNLVEMRLNSSKSIITDDGTDDGVNHIDVEEEEEVEVNDNDHTKDGEGDDNDEEEEEEEDEDGENVKDMSFSVINEDMIGMVTVDDDDDDDDDMDIDPEVTETENEEAPLLNQQNNNNNDGNESVGNQSVATVRTYKSSNLP